MKNQSVKTKILLRTLVYAALVFAGAAVALPVILDRLIKLDAVKPKLEKSLSDFLRRKTTIETLEWDWFPRPTLSGLNVSIKEKDGSVILEAPCISIYPKINKLIRRRIDIRSLEIISPALLIKRSKDAAFNLSTLYDDIRNHANEQKKKDGSQVQIVLRKIRMQKARLVLVDENVDVRPIKPAVIADADIDIPADAPVFMSLRAVVADQKKRGTLAIESLPAGAGGMSLKARDIPLACFGDYFPPLNEVNGRCRIDGKFGFTPRLNWDIDIKSTQPGIPGDPFEIKAFSAGINGYNVHVSTCRLIALGGTIEGRGTVNGAGSPSSTFNLEWRVENLDIIGFQKATGLDLRATGRLRSEGTLAGDWPNIRSANLNGSFTVQLTSGSLAGIPGLVKFLSAFNMKSLFRKMESGKKEGLPFSVAQGTFSVTNGIMATIVPAKIESETVDIALMGSTDWPRYSINSDMVVQFLNPIDEAVNILPGVRTLLLNGKKTFLPICAKVKGPVDNPEVNIQTAKSIGKKGWDTITGVLKIPGRVMSAILNEEGGK